MTTQQEFSLAGKVLKLTSKEDAKPHVDQLNSMPNVEKIVLSGNTLGIDASESIASALKDKHDLKVCDLSDIFTGRLRSEIPVSLQFITEALRDKKNLVHLDLSDNAFGPDGLRPVVPLISALQSLQVLKVNNTGLGPQGGELLAESLVGLHETCKKAGKVSQLETVVCGRSRLENGSMEALANAFKSHPNLKQVVLPQDGIRPEGIVKLMNGLKECGKLECVDLQDNTFTDVGAKALADALPSWPNLKKLNIGDCMLTSKGAKFVFEALKSHNFPHLEVLNLQYNEIDEKTVLYLASILPDYGKSLKSLELNGNCFSEDGVGADAVRDALENEDILGSLSDMEEADSDLEAEEEDEEDDLTKGISEL